MGALSVRVDSLGGRAVRLLRYAAAPHGCHATVRNHADTAGSARRTSRHGRSGRVSPPPTPNPPEQLCE